MNKKKHPGYLYYFAGVCFIIAGMVGEMVTFYPIGICMFVLGIINKK